MQFRRIYWVAEEVRAGEKTLVGVFTSSNDLLERYLMQLGDQKPDSICLTLVKLDQAGRPLGRWESGQFGDLRADLQQFIDTNEFTVDECDRLANSLIVL